MNRLIIFAAMMLTIITTAQTIYDVEPGTKGNRIKLTVSNISELNPAEGVEVKLVKNSSTLSFKKETETIELLEPEKESDAIFSFDINRNALVNLPTGQAGKKDTIEFMISDRAYRQTGINGLMTMKSFVFNYTPPKEFKLEQNYPNPFNPTTTIQYQLPAEARVTLKVYDILGSEVKTLVNEEQEAGYKEVQFNGSNFASGMYIYRLTAGNYASIKKMMLVK